LLYDENGKKTYMLQLQAPKESIELEKRPSPKEVPLYIRLILSFALLVLGFALSNGVYFKENPLFGKPLLAEVLIAILMALFGFYLLPKTFSGIKHWLQEIILEFVSDIVSNFWEQQSEKMREARLEREERKKKEEQNREEKKKAGLEGQLLLDTSVLIDGRILDIAKTGFLLRDAVVPEFVIKELHTLSDSKDPMKRKKGRRGLDIVRQLKKEVTVHTPSNGLPEEQVKKGVDEALVEYAKMYQTVLVSLDFNLNKVASVKGLKVVNINDLANALRMNLLPGEELEIKLVDAGQGKGQAIGYLEDGTMVIVSDGVEKLGSVVHVKIKKSLQGSSGRMFFAEIVEVES
jgi:uncharacterized protein YacL